MTREVCYNHAHVVSNHTNKGGVRGLICHKCFRHLNNFFAAEMVLTQVTTNQTSAVFYKETLRAGAGQVSLRAETSLQANTNYKLSTKSK